MDRKDASASIELVAVERGFINGHVVEPGSKFRFTGSKLPRWAVPVGTPMPPAPAWNGDTRPPAAQKASQEYRQGAFGSQQGNHIRSVSRD